MKNISGSVEQMNPADELRSLLHSRVSEMTFYSPFSFLRNIEPDTLCRETFIEPLLGSVQSGTTKVSVEVTGSRRTFIVWKALPWDSEYFHRRVFRIELILADHDDAEAISAALKRFTGSFTSKGDYIFLTVPCEDLPVLCALSYAGFRLVETRMNYFFPGFVAVESIGSPVRMAETSDIPALREVAMKMRNRFDRVHADPAFTDEEADNYLGTFAEQSVRGFADIVMVPNIPGVKPFGFLAANNPESIMGLNIAKLVLAAVDNREYRGWLSYLLQEVMYELKKRNTDILTTITQAANRPAIHTWEKAGFMLGFVTHVYSYSNQ